MPPALRAHPVAGRLQHGGTMALEATPSLVVIAIVVLVAAVVALGFWLVPRARAGDRGRRDEARSPLLPETLPTNGASPPARKTPAAPDEPPRRRDAAHGS
jgi:hypothetical protein